MAIKILKKIKQRLCLQLRSQAENLDDERTIDTTTHEQTLDVLLAPNRFIRIGPDVIEFICYFLLPFERFKLLAVDKQLHHILLRSQSTHYPHSSNVIYSCNSNLLLNPIRLESNLSTDLVYWKRSFQCFFDLNWQLLCISYGNFSNLEPAQLGQLKYFLIYQAKLIQIYGANHEGNKMVEILSNLKELYLQKNPYSCVFAFINDVLASPYSLISTLDLSNNNCTDSDIRSLCKALASRSKKYTICYLSDFSLCSNKAITNQGLEVLLDTIGMHNIPIKHLHLSNCDLDDESCELFCRHFKKHHKTSNFEKIYLAKNQAITSNGISRLDSLFKNRFVSPFHVNFRIYVDGCCGGIKSRDAAWDYRIYFFNGEIIEN